MARSFTDANGQTWQVFLSIDAARRLQDADLSAIWPEPLNLLDRSQLSEGFFTRILTDTGAMCELCWLIIQPDAAERGVSYEDFAKAIGGPQAAEIRDVMWAEFTDFFHDHRTWLSRLIAAYREAQDQLGKEMSRVAEQQAAALGPMITEEVTRMTSGIGKPST